MFKRPFFILAIVVITALLGANQFFGYTKMIYEPLGEDWIQESNLAMRAIPPDWFNSESQFFEHTTEVFGLEEGFLFKTNVSVTSMKSAENQLVVILEESGLPDDSVESIRYRVDYVFDNSRELWQIEWAGRSFKCHRSLSIVWQSGLCS